MGQYLIPATVTVRSTAPFADTVSQRAMNGDQTAQSIQASFTSQQLRDFQGEFDNPGLDEDMAAILHGDGEEDGFEEEDDFGEEEEYDEDDYEEEEEDDDDDDEYGDDEDDDHLTVDPRTSSTEFAGVDCIYPRRSFKGARNVETVKDCNFLGVRADKVAAGSDDGHFFVWDKESGKLEGIWEGDGSVVNSEWGVLTSTCFDIPAALGAGVAG